MREGAGMLRVGEAAPEFTLLDLGGDEWRLGDQPEETLVLSWIRGEW